LALEGYAIRPIDCATAMRVVVRLHYLKRKAPCSVAFGLYRPVEIVGNGNTDPQLRLDGHDLCGVVCYGTPSSAPLRSGIAGPEHADNVVELTRLWVADDVPRNAESYLIGNTVKHAGKEIIVSFAEIDAGHVGTIYQAANWLYTGLSAKRTNWTIEGDRRHGQSIADQWSAEKIRAAYGDRFSIQPRPRKHRYVWINAKGGRRRELMRALRYRPEPYPKATGPTQENAPDRA
jgi:hypothetical protein